MAHSKRGHPPQRNAPSIVPLRIKEAPSQRAQRSSHCTQRNRTLAAAARSLAENAALARDLAELGRALGKETLAARLEQEAARGRQNFEQIQVMLEGLAQQPE
jgi:hypothetical protein